MPIYEYRCADGHSFEVIQSMSDDPVTACEVCGEPVERVFHPVAVHFKGSGFYTTDYKGKSKAGASSDGDSSSSKEAKAETGGSKTESKGDSKGSNAGGTGDSAAKAGSGSE